LEGPDNTEKKRGEKPTGQKRGGCFKKAAGPALPTRRGARGEAVDR